MSTSLLHYRAWQGSFRWPIWSIWPIARISLGMLLRRRLFWVFYALGMLLFLMFFFGSYLFAWAEVQIASAPRDPIAGPNFDPRRMLQFIRQGIKVLNGSQETFQYFFGYQGTMVIVTLALAGSVLVGNDFQFRSLVFYLAKPIGRWHYLLGKCLATALVVTMLTTLPALGLFSQHAFDDWDYLLNPNYFGNDVPGGIFLLLGILGYGAILAVVLSIMLVTTASVTRRTMPMIMVWISLFFFPRLLANLLVDGLKYDVHWRLIDLWNDLALLGNECLGIEPRPQPDFGWAALVLSGVCILCLISLNRRTRSVEVVR